MAQLMRNVQQLRYAANVDASPHSVLVEVGPSAPVHPVEWTRGGLALSVSKQPQRQPGSMPSANFLAWNRAAEEQLARVYDTPLPPGTRSLLSTVPSTPLSQSDLDDLTEQTRFLADKARSCQLNFGLTLVEDASEGRRREEAWLAFEPEKQRELLEVVLEELTIGLTWKATREQVPEIRIGKLLDRGGRGFLELAESCVDPGGVGHEVRWVKNERFDAIVGTLE